MNPDQFSYMARFSKTHKGVLPHLRWSALQELVMVGFTTSGQQYLHVATVTRPSLQAKLKLDENGHALKVASDKISYFVDMFLHFFKNDNFCFTNIQFHFKN